VFEFGVGFRLRRVWVVVVVRVGLKGKDVLVCFETGSGWLFFFEVIKVGVGDCELTRVGRKLRVFVVERRISVVVVVVSRSGVSGRC
jgi:hypothetical protein